MADGRRGLDRHHPDCRAAAQPYRAPALGCSHRRGSAAGRGHHRGPWEDRSPLSPGPGAVRRADRDSRGDNTVVHDRAHRASSSEADLPPSRAGHCWRPGASSGCPTASPSACCTGSSTAAGRPCEPTGCRPTPTSPSPSSSRRRSHPANWRPRFVDYLYLGFTSATAFSPTDAMPLRPWNKTRDDGPVDDLSGDPGPRHRARGQRAALGAGSNQVAWKLPTQISKRQDHVPVTPVARG